MIVAAERKPFLRSAPDSRARAGGKMFPVPRVSCLTPVVQFCVYTACWHPFSFARGRGQFNLEFSLFRSEPGTGADPHQRSSPKLTACSSYSDCKITLSGPFFFFVSPDFQYNNWLCLTHPPIGLRSPVLWGGMGDVPVQRWREGFRRPPEQRVRRRRSGLNACVVSPWTHIAYRLRTRFLFLCFFSSTWCSDICKDLWQEGDGGETMHANRWRAEIVVDVASEKKKMKYLYVIISHFMCTI